MKAADKHERVRQAREEFGMSLADFFDKAYAGRPKEEIVQKMENFSAGHHPENAALEFIGRERQRRKRAEKTRRSTARKPAMAASASA